MSSAEAIVTAASAAITAISLILTALTVFIPLLRQIHAVHTIVNQSQTDMRRYQQALVSALQRAGVEVPPDQSIEPETP